jgi:hypothetical protein
MENLNLAPNLIPPITLRLSCLKDVLLRNVCYIKPYPLATMFDPASDELDRFLES